MLTISLCFAHMGLQHYQESQADAPVTAVALCFWAGLHQLTRVPHSQFNPHLMSGPQVTANSI